MVDARLREEVEALAESSLDAGEADSTTFLGKLAFRSKKVSSTTILSGPGSSIG